MLGATVELKLLLTDGLLMEVMKKHSVNES